MPALTEKIAKMALFNPCMEFKFFLGQMTSFEVLRKCHFVILSKICLRLRPCAYLGGSKWINSIISISAHRKWPEMVVSASTNQVWTKITIRSYVHVFCHSESDRSSVHTHYYVFSHRKTTILREICEFDQLVTTTFFSHLEINQVIQQSTEKS